MLNKYIYKYICKIRIVLSLKVICRIICSPHISSMRHSDKGWTVWVKFISQYISYFQLKLYDSDVDMNIRTANKCSQQWFAPTNLYRIDLPNNVMQYVKNISRISDRQCRCSV